MEPETPPNGSRRTVLKSLGAAAGLVAGSGCIGVPVGSGGGSRSGSGGGAGTATASSHSKSEHRGEVAATEGFDVTIGPGSDRTIQWACDHLPYFNRGHEFVIRLEPGTYDENVALGPCMSGGDVSRPIQIIGDENNPEEYRVGSILANGIFGVNGITIKGVTFTQTSDQISDGAACWLYNSSATIEDCRFEPAGGGTFEAGIEAYHGSSAKTDNVDVSSCQHGIKAKRMSKIWSKDTTGHAAGYLYWATETGAIGYWHQNSSPSAGQDVGREDNSSSVVEREGQMPANLMFSMPSHYMPETFHQNF